MVLFSAATSGEHDAAVFECVKCLDQSHKGLAYASVSWLLMKTHSQGGGQRSWVFCLFICQQSKEDDEHVSPVHNKSVVCKAHSLCENLERQEGKDGQAGRQVPLPFFFLKACVYCINFMLFFLKD